MNKRTVVGSVAGGVRPRVPLWAILGIAFAVLLVPACASDVPQVGKHAMVTGGVDLPADAVSAYAELRVRLVDLTEPERVLGRSTIKDISASRVPFAVRYDPSQLVDDHSYVVEVEILRPGIESLEAAAPIEVNPHDQKEIQIALDPSAPRPVYAGGQAPQTPEASDVIVVPAGASSDPAL